MATLLLPREQVEAVLTERIRAGEELIEKAEIAEKAAGERDWLYLFARWREHTIAELAAVYDGDDVPFEFDASTRTVQYSSPRHTLPYTKSSLELGLWVLRTLIERLPLAVEPTQLQAVRPRAEGAASETEDSGSDRQVFIVHGRTAGGFLDRVARFVENLGLRPVILAEQASEGRTIIEKFEAHAVNVRYAVALLTPEDSGHGPEDDSPPHPNRARQNVILELGYFMGRLGRKNVVALQQEGLELPSDILGIVYIPLDEGRAWKTLLARELQAAGYDLDLNGLLG
jgi:predicted nucleotide-binding protein